MRRIAPASFDDRIGLVDRLDELRARLVVCLAPHCPRADSSSPLDPAGIVEAGGAPQGS